MERYRSGHNEAVLKTVCPKGRVGVVNSGARVQIPPSALKIKKIFKKIKKVVDKANDL